MEQKEFLEFKNTLKEKAITLVAVSKTRNISEIRRFYDYGQRDFGENYVQELVGKHDGLPADTRWHFIGHLQRNKVKDIAGFVHLIHGIDSEKLLREVNKQALKQNRTIGVLLQVHIADEATKFGLDESEVREIVNNTGSFPNVMIKGLMGMATLTDSVSKINGEFERLHRLFEQFKTNADLKYWDTLSMGMSGDYKTAIANGSTMVRIGTMIFGARS